MQRGRHLALRSGDRDPHHSNSSGASLSRGQRRSLSERIGPAASDGQATPIAGSSQATPRSLGGGIERGRLVENLASGSKVDEGVRESDRDQELAPVFGREFDRDMSAEGRRGAANVDRDVEDAAARAAHQLVLGERRRLEVQPAQGADRRRIGMVVLHEGELKPRLVPVGAVVDLGEKPSGVAVLLRRHDLDRRNRGLFHLHRGPPSFARPVRARPLLARTRRARPPQIAPGQLRGGCRRGPLFVINNTLKMLYTCLSPRMRPHHRLSTGYGAVEEQAEAVTL